MLTNARLRDLAIIAVLAGCASSQGAGSKPTEPEPPAISEREEDRFRSVTAGFSITKPSDWRFASAQEVAENQGRVRFNDEQLNELIGTRARLPLVIINKYAEPYESLNPTVQVLLRPLGQLEGEPPTRVLETFIQPLEDIMVDYAVAEPIQDTTVDGLPAAYGRITYTLQTDAGDFPAASRVWVVPRGKLLFMISAAGPSDGEDVSELEFETAMASIRIER